MVCEECGLLKKTKSSEALMNFKRTCKLMISKLLKSSFKVRAKKKSVSGAEIKKSLSFRRRKLAE